MINTPSTSRLNECGRQRGGLTDHYGEVHNFDALVGMLLSDVPEKMSGELCVYPGSHVALAEYFKQGSNLQDLAAHGHSKLPTGAPTDRLFKRPVVHCTGKAGDCFLANYMTAHLIAPVSGRADPGVSRPRASVLT